MLIATAGHVDHGKTLLVRTLTGVDTDRLPEEKSRGLSIDLGFAYRELDSGTVLGFVDVPGHEKFVRNMLAGVAAIDFGLLVVAADDGVMPQTREHLDILGLMGLDRAAVAADQDRPGAPRTGGRSGGRGARAPRPHHARGRGDPAALRAHRRGRGGAPGAPRAQRRRPLGALRRGQLPPRHRPRVHRERRRGGRHRRRLRGPGGGRRSAARAAPRALCAGAGIAGPDTGTRPAAGRDSASPST